MSDWMAGMTDFQRAEVARLESRIVSFEKRWESLEADWNDCKKALTALVAERNALRSELEGERQRFVKHLEDASRVVQTWPTWKQEVLGGTAVQTPAASDLRERLVCAALTGLCADPRHDVCEEVAVAVADRTLAAMRKGEQDGK